MGASRVSVHGWLGEEPRSCGDEVMNERLRFENLLAKKGESCILVKSLALQHCNQTKLGRRLSPSSSRRDDAICSVPPPLAIQKKHDESETNGESEVGTGVLPKHSPRPRPVIAWHGRLPTRQCILFFCFGVLLTHSASPTAITYVVISRTWRVLVSGPTPHSSHAHTPRHTPKHTHWTGQACFHSA